jgi:hypothetical protein
MATRRFAWWYWSLSVCGVASRPDALRFSAVWSSRPWNVVDALYVRNTLAERPFMPPFASFCRNLFTADGCAEQGVSAAAQRCSI